MSPTYELMVYANLTDMNATPFPPPPGYDQYAHFFSYIPDDPVLRLGVRLSVGSLAGVWLESGPPSQFITSSSNPYFPEYNGLALWGDGGAGAGPGGTDTIVDYCILDISAAPAAGTPVSNICTIRFHAAMDQPPAYVIPPPVVTLTPHADPLGINNYIDVSAEERFSPDSRLPIMWYRWLTGGAINLDGSVTSPGGEITDYADVPLGPRRRTFTYGPVPNGSYQFACAPFEPMFGKRYPLSDFASITFMGDLGHWTVSLPAPSKVAAGAHLIGSVRT